MNSGACTICMLIDSCLTIWLHVPTDGEWDDMTETLGGDAIAGEMMKTTFGWLDNGNGTNSSGFSGLPGGGVSRLVTSIMQAPLAIGGVHH